MTIRIGISACLLGQACRYDGRSKPCQIACKVLNRLAELVPLCPECECGLGCPRIAMDLRTAEQDGEILLTDKQGGEHGPQMREWLERKLPQLTDVDGFVLKARSPSCGVGDAPLNGGPERTDGLFTAAVRARFHDVPVCSEASLSTEEDCVAFVEKVSRRHLLKRVEERVRGILAASPACHDWDHTLRVWKNARRLMALTRQLVPTVCMDETVVDIAALMHDIGRLQELEDHGKTNHAVAGAEQSIKILHELGVENDDFCRRVASCIRSHRYRRREGNDVPDSIEAKIVYDADKLDSIGAIGIGRAFHFAGRVGARVHNHADEALASASYSREDSAYREYLVKLRHVRDCLLTEAGRRLAEHRHQFMEAFFNELNRECD